MYSFNSSGSHLLHTQHFSSSSVSESISSASVKWMYDVYYTPRLPPDVQIELQRRTADFEISFVRPKSIPEKSKNCQKARPLFTSCMMFAPPTYLKFATCVDCGLRTSHFPLAGVLLTAVSSVAAPF